MSPTATAMLQFEWDEDKDIQNRAKHKVGFTEAQTVFRDESAIELEASRNGEYRIIRIGKSAAKFLLLIVYTMRGMAVRIISARQANRNERNLYLEHKLKKRANENPDR